MNFAKGGSFIPIGVASTRTMLLDCFPLGLSLSEDYPGGDSAELALPITQWPTDKPNRLVVMEMAGYLESR